MNCLVRWIVFYHHLLLMVKYYSFVFTLLIKVKFLHIFSFHTSEKPKQAFSHFMSICPSVTLADVFFVCFSQGNGWTEFNKTWKKNFSWYFWSNIGSLLFWLFHRFKILWHMFLFAFHKNGRVDFDETLHEAGWFGYITYDHCCFDSFTLTSLPKSIWSFIFSVI